MWWPIIIIIVCNDTSWITLSISYWIPQIYCYVHRKTTTTTKKPHCYASWSSIVSTSNDPDARRGSRHWEYVITFFLSWTTLSESKFCAVPSSELCSLSLGVTPSLLRDPYSDRVGLCSLWAKATSFLSEMIEAVFLNRLEKLLSSFIRRGKRKARCQKIINRKPM